MKRRTAFLYIRRSVNKTGREVSPDMQIAACEQKAGELKLHTETYRDTETHSSGRTEDRPGWQAMRARLDDPDAAAVIVYSLDRAARNVQTMLAFIDDLDRRGIKFVSCQENLDTSTASGRLMLTLLGGIHEWYSNDISEKRARSIDALRRLRGRHWGIAPFGAERCGPDRVLVPSTKQQTNGTDHQALTRLYELRTGDRLSYDQIAGRMNTDGWRFRNRRGELRPFLVDDVRRAICQHWIFAGYVVIGSSHHPGYDVIPGSHAPLLPERLTAAVAGQLERAPSPRRTRIRQLHPLTHLIHCAACSAPLYGSTEHRRRIYRHRLACEAVSQHDAETIEARVREHLAGLAARLPARLVENARRMAARMLLADQRGVSPRSERRRIGEKLERLKDLYVEGELTRDEYGQRKAALEQDLAGIVDDLIDVPASALALLGADEPIQDAGAHRLRELARLFYARVEVQPDGTVCFTPREWVKPWRKRRAD